LPATRTSCKRPQAAIKLLIARCLSLLFDIAASLHQPTGCLVHARIGRCETQPFFFDFLLTSPVDASLLESSQSKIATPQRLHLSIAEAFRRFGKSHE
jgi:hypothetical protein